MDEPDVIKRFKEECAAEKALRARGSTVDGIAELSGLPRWLIFKTVAGELADLMIREHSETSERTELFGDLVAAALDFAVQHTREDGFAAIWRSRRKDHLEWALKEYMEHIGWRKP